MRERNMGKKF